MPDGTVFGVENGDVLGFELVAELVAFCPIFFGAGGFAIDNELFLFFGDIRGGIGEIEAQIEIEIIDEAGVCPDVFGELGESGIEGGEGFGRIEIIGKGVADFVVYIDG